MTTRRTVNSIIALCLLGGISLHGATSAAAQPVVLFDGCQALARAHAQGWLETGAGLRLEVLAVPEAAATEGCLRALTPEGRVFNLRSVRIQPEAGLALFDAELSTGKGSLPAKPSALSLPDLEVLSRASDSHLVPWLDRGLELLAPRPAKDILPGTPVLDARGRLVGLVTTQALATSSPTGLGRLFVIPAEFTRNWRSLLRAGKLPANGALSLAPLRSSQALPNGYKPGLVLDPRVASGADPMGINGELVAAAERSPHGPRAHEILRALEERRLLGVFVKRDGIWFQVTPRSLVDTVELLALEPTVVAALQPENPDQALVAHEIEAQRVLRRLRDGRSLEVAYLADQVRILALLSQTGDPAVHTDAHLLLDASSRWAPLWGALRRDLPSEAAILEAITRALAGSGGAKR